MPEPFNAYYKWLLIPPDEQPPDHYQLLGISQGEPDLAVIESAVNQRKLFLETHLSGPHKSYAIFLLKEIQSAHGVLTNAALKQQYDANLSQIPVARLAPTTPAAATNPPPPLPPTSNQVSPTSETPYTFASGTDSPALPPGQSPLMPPAAGNQPTIPAPGQIPMPGTAATPPQILPPQGQSPAIGAQQGQLPQFNQQVQQSAYATPVQTHLQSETSQSLGAVRPQKRKDQSMLRAVFIIAGVIGGGLSAVALVAILRPFIVPADSDQPVVVDHEDPPIEVESDAQRRQRQKESRRVMEEKRKEKLRLVEENRKREEEAQIVHQQYLKEKRERELAELENRVKPKQLLQPLDGQVGLRLLIGNSDSMIGSTRTDTQLVTNSDNFKAIGLTYPGTTISAAIDDMVFDHAQVVADSEGDFEIDFELNQGLNNILMKIERTGNATLTIRVPVYRLSGPVIRVTTTAGQFAIELFEEDAPNAVANFRRYLDRFHDSIVHRSAHRANRSDFIIQGGLYRYEDGALSVIRREDPVANEFNQDNSNVRGAIAWVHPDDDIDGATSQWLINMADNSSMLDAQSYTVFGRVVGSMSALEKIHGSPEFDLTDMGFGKAAEVPLANFTREQFDNDLEPKRENFFILTFVEPVGDDHYGGRLINFVLN